MAEGESLTELIKAQMAAQEKQHQELMQAIDKLPIEIAEAIAQLPDTED